MSSAAAAAPPADPKLYHVLMAEDDDDNNKKGAGPSSTTKRVQSQSQPLPTLLSPKLQNDYLGRRFRALQEAKTTTSKKGSKKKAPPKKSAEEELWCGASAVERSLVACCVTSTANSSNPQEDTATVASNEDDNSYYANDDWSPVAGALARDQVVTFVGRVALHCQTASQRGLALAILERSQEADATDQAWWKEEAAALAAGEGGEQPGAAAVETEEKSNNEVRTIDERPPAKRTRRSAPLPPDDKNGLDRKPSAKVASTKSVGKKDDVSSKTSSKTRNNDVDIDDGDAAAPVESMSPRVVRVQQKMLPDRLRLFLQAGGLRILSRWLIEAATPVKPPPSKANSKKTAAAATTPAVAVPNQEQQNKEAPTEHVASPTGPLLLPLVLFLQKLPFDLQAIKQSRINKAIKGINKKLDAILPPPPKASKDSAAAAADGTSAAVEASRTDPVAGGLSVAQVQAAVSELMRIWEEQASKAKQDESKRNDDLSQESAAAADPFANLQAALEERAQQLSQYYAEGRDEASNASNGYPTDSSATINEQQHALPPLPDWLAQWHAECQQQSSKSAASRNSATKTTTQTTNVNSSSSAADKHRRTEELARKERENERAAMMKADLARAQEQRRELLRKLRQKQNQAAAAAGKSRFGSAHSGRAQSKGVRWKDGLGAASRQRKRDILEEVFVFVKDKDVLAAAAAAEEQEASSSSDVPVDENAAAATAASNATGAGDEARDTNTSNMNEEGEIHDPSQL